MHKLIQKSNCWWEHKFSWHMIKYVRDIRRLHPVVNNDSGQMWSLNFSNLLQFWQHWNFSHWRNHHRLQYLTMEKYICNFGRLNTYVSWCFCMMTSWVNISTSFLKKNGKIVFKWASDSSRQWNSLLGHEKLMFSAQWY